MKKNQRMMVYAWQDLDNTADETKFGDHMAVGTFDKDPVKDTVKYIKTQFPRRTKHFDTGKVLYQVWDITEIAKKNDRFYKGSHIDDVIGESIGRRGTKQGKEFHSLSFEDVKYRVNEYIKKSEQPLPLVGLMPWQYEDGEEILAEIKKGKRTFLAELCARYGKTIWAGALAVESGVRVTVIASYVLTSFTSFANDLNAFEQFRNIELIDSAHPDYKKKIAKALNDGKQIVIFLSMVSGSKRQDRIDHIFGLAHSRFVFIDEADYGAHRFKQSDPFIKAQQSKDVFVLMTGTNGERACGNWKIDHYIGRTYAELLMEKAGF